MLLNCNNKGCHKNVEALYDEKTHEVVCPECHQVITGISESMKRTLKSFGQIVRDEEKKAFMMACKSCNANRQVVLNENDETVCNICGEKINVHPSMREAILAVGERVKSEPKPVSKPKKGRPKKTK
jgi:hypothetical protein